MGPKSSVIVIVIFWIISFVEPSGWSMLLDLPDRVNIIILVVSIICYALCPSKRLPISRKFFWMIGVFLAMIPFLVSSTWQGASYLVSFLTVYIVSQGAITEKVVKYTGLAIAGLGIFILYIYVYGNILSGWNDNAMSMVGLFSYLYFSIYLISNRGKKAFWFWNIVTLIYLDLMFRTDCRSGMLFSILSVMAIYYSKPVKELLEKYSIRLLILNLPLIVSFVVISVASSTYFERLNEWSLMNFEKDIFNGRDLLWDTAYKMLADSDYIGTGKFLINYHNSGVAAITVFGVLGYICWIKFFSNNLKTMAKYFSDNIIFGSTLSFLIIFLQQSFDLGFICEYPNLLPYTILGIGLGRVRMLQQTSV